MLEFIGGIAVGIVLCVILYYLFSTIIIKKFFKLKMKEWVKICKMAYACGNNRPYSITAEYKNGNQSLSFKR